MCLDKHCRSRVLPGIQRIESLSERARVWLSGGFCRGTAMAIIRWVWLLRDGRLNRWISGNVEGDSGCCGELLFRAISWVNRRYFHVR
jgi:hypothetical protein